MKYFLAAFCLISTHVFSQQIETPLKYQLEFLENRIHVDLVYQPLEKDSSTFTYGQPAFGGQLDIFRGLQNIKVENPVQVKVDSINRKVIFYYSQLVPVKISYDVVDTRLIPSTRSQLFRPIIMPDYFFVHGVNLFLTPDLRNKNIKPRVSVEWKKLPDFPIFYTFDPDNNGTTPSVTTVDSISLRFMTGAKDLTVKKFTNESGTNYLVLRAANMPAVVSAELENFYVMYNKEMREFWKDTRKIKYSLILQPYLNVDHKISGVSFGNGFIGKYNKPDSLVKGIRKFVIAHEIGHYYLSDVEAFEGDNSLGQWFNEGFNDYQTFFNLLRSKSMTPEEFQNDFNEIFKDLYNSPIKDTPNHKIFENFWKLGDYAKLPYWRGCVYAFYLDNQIALATKDKKSFRDLMLDLKELMQEKTKKEFTNDEFIAIVSKYLPKDNVEKEFNDFILNGEAIHFDNSTLLPLFSVKMTAQYPVLTIENKKKFMAHFHYK